MSSPRAPSSFAPRAELRIPLPRGFVAALASARVDVDALARDARVHLSRLSAPRPTVTADELAALYASLFDPSAPSDLGLRIGACIKAELFGVVGLAALSAATYGAAVQRCVRYKRMITDMRLRVRTTADTAVVTVEVPGPTATSRGRTDIELGFLATFGRTATTQPVEPRHVYLRRPAPGDDAHAVFFDCPVSFSADADELHLPAAAMQIPLLGADAEAHDALVELAERRLGEGDDPLVAEIRNIVERQLAEGPPRLSVVARKVAMSERSLQRALRQRETSYVALIDATRRDLALRLLRADRCRIVEVAYLVGFSHLSSFYRAFERWTGTSPATFPKETTADAAHGPTTA